MENYTLEGFSWTTLNESIERSTPYFFTALLEKDKDDIGKSDSHAKSSLYVLLIPTITASNPKLMSNSPKY